MKLTLILMSSFGMQTMEPYSRKNIPDLGRTANGRVTSVVKASILRSLEMRITSVTVSRSCASIRLSSSSYELRHTLLVCKS